MEGNGKKEEGKAIHKAIAMKKIDGKPGQVWYPLHILSTPIAPFSSQSNNLLLLRPTHISLNHRDIFLRQHLYPQPSFTTPLFSDACCTILSPQGSPTQRRVLPAPAHNWDSDPLGPEPGSKASYAILGGTSTTHIGLGQQYVQLPESEVEECPSHLTSAEAAALPLVGLTAWRALVTKSGAAEKGKNILVTGIGGGVALAVLQFAVAIGVNVWVTSASSEKITKAKELGAKGGVSYKEEKWERALKSTLPKDRPYLDAIIDGAGGNIAEVAPRLLRTGGVLVTYGMTVAPKISVPMMAVLANIEIKGSTMGSRKEFGDMVAFVREKKVRPIVSQVLRVEGGWDDEKELLEKLELLYAEMRAGRQFGKLVLDLGVERVGDETSSSGSKL
ncbi:MAG: hypothetical protein MMC33_001906 [Icmadophila ericetorum]|nr:hypothetical protein [Icmadophila ericetorum]